MVQMVMQTILDETLVVQNDHESALSDTIFEPTDSTIIETNDDTSSFIALKDHQSLVWSLSLLVMMAAVVF